MKVFLFICLLTKPHQNLCETPPEFMSVNDYHETSSFFSVIPSYMFHNYCVNQFGLVTEEIDYLWEKYGNIMNLKYKSELRKIKNK
jgi:hypothetical protein